MNRSQPNAQIQQYRHRMAMTLVELMVAIALSALLMSALVGVLGGISKQVKLSERHETAVWPSRFITLLRRDLGAAESLWLDAGVLWMRTDVPGYHSDASGVRQIGYRCAVTESGVNLLERIDSGRISVLAIGPVSLHVERIDSVGTPQPLPRTPGPVPNQIRIWIDESRSNYTPFVRDLMVHG